MTSCPNKSDQPWTAGLSDLVRGFFTPLHSRRRARTLVSRPTARSGARLAPVRGVRNVPTPGAGVGTPSRPRSASMWGVGGGRTGPGWPDRTRLAARHPNGSSRPAPKGLAGRGPEGGCSRAGHPNGGVAGPVLDHLGRPAIIFVAPCSDSDFVIEEGPLPGDPHVHQRLVIPGRPVPGHPRGSGTSRSSQARCRAASSVSTGWAPATP